MTLDVYADLGSSPHARGKQDATIEHSAAVRLIPACAGKTDRLDLDAAAGKAHPRMRGENPVCCRSSRSGTGSSPHARGKRGAPGVSKKRPGLIPACAGKTPGLPISRRMRRAHPRMRGENFTGPCLAPEDWGSSPHARGKRSQASQRTRDKGLIPACAGKTGVTPPCDPADWAHPRMRGENYASSVLPRTGRGSSPHARGKP